MLKFQNRLKTHHYMNLGSEYWRLYSNALNVRHLLINASLTPPPPPPPPPLPDLIPIRRLRTNEQNDENHKIVGALNINEDKISRLDSIGDRRHHFGIGRF
jgi:hypothetical protein